jgi:hypothetical protein
VLALEATSIFLFWILPSAMSRQGRWHNAQSQTLNHCAIKVGQNYCDQIVFMALRQHNTWASGEIIFIKPTPHHGRVRLQRGAEG